MIIRPYQLGSAWLCCGVVGERRKRHASPLGMRSRSQSAASSGEDFAEAADYDVGFRLGEVEGVDH